MNEKDTNTQQAALIETVLDTHYNNWRINSGAEHAASDLLADLMHFCRAKGVDFDEVLRRADDYFNYEITSSEEIDSDDE